MNKLSEIFNIILNFIKKVWSHINNFSKKVLKIISPFINKFIFIMDKLLFTLNDSIIYYSAMFIFSFSIIALEIIYFHILLIVTNYLKATFIISIAMLGIATGSFISFYLLRFKTHVILILSGIVFFFSIILSYYNIINIGELKYPFYLILPFISGTVIISSIFAKEHSNISYFINLIGSASGVIFPIIFVRLVKSENSLILLLFVPLIFLFIMSFKYKNIIPRFLLKAVSVTVFILLIFLLKRNLGLPEKIETKSFEKEILPKLYVWDRIYADEFDDIIKKKYLNKIKKDKKKFIESLYEYNDFDNYYELTENTTIKDRIKGMEILKEAGYSSFVTKFIDRAYIKNTTDNCYDLTGDSYDKKRAKYLLSEIGFDEKIKYSENDNLKFIKEKLFALAGSNKTIDLNIDVKPHRLLKENMKIYNVDSRILLSEDSLLGRVELLGDDEYMNLAINGVILDGLDSYNGAYYDPRLPHIENAKVFIVGLSADGIVKSAKRLKNVKKVSGIEINPTVLKIMREDGQFSKFSHYPYKDVEVHFGEGRSFLETTAEKYDIITLMNIHMEHGPICTLSPEFFHTVEGTKLLLNNLTERGFVVYEEIIMGSRAKYAYYKFLNTAVKALEEIGVEKPSKCIHVFKWDFWGKNNAFRTISIKRTPFTDQEIKDFDTYIKGCKKWYEYLEVTLHPSKKMNSEVEKIIFGEEKTYSMIDIPTSFKSYDFIHKVLKKINSDSDLNFISSIYHHNKRWNTYYLGRINDKEEKKLIKILNKINYPYEIDLAPVTDDKPFPFNIYKNKKEVLEILQIVIFLSMILLFPIFLLLIHKSGKYKLSQFTQVLFFGILGFGYMLVEIVLMQKYQRFIGNPTYSLVITLGGLLLFSGIGSFVSRFLPKKILIICLLFIPVILVLKLFFLDKIFVFFGKNGFFVKLFISSLLLFPLTFLMGMPFPNALEHIKKLTSNEYGTLMFGISGAFSTIASTSSIMISVTYGFKMSFMIGILCYLAGVLLFIIITRKRAA